MQNDTDLTVYQARTAAEVAENIHQYAAEASEALHKAELLSDRKSWPLFFSITDLAQESERFIAMALRKRFLDAATFLIGHCNTLRSELMPPAPTADATPAIDLTEKGKALAETLSGDGHESATVRTKAKAKAKTKAQKRSETARAAAHARWQAVKKPAAKKPARKPAAKKPSARKTAAKKSARKSRR